MEMLGYPDSGMAGPPGSTRAEAFCNVDVEVAAANWRIGSIEPRVSVGDLRPTDGLRTPPQGAGCSVWPGARSNVVG